MPAKTKSRAKIPVTALARLFGWSPSRLKKVLSEGGCCLKDGTPCGPWAAKVEIKEVESAWDPGAIAEMRLWPKQEILEELERLGHTPLGDFERKCQVTAWASLHKPIYQLLDLVEESIPAGSWDEICELDIWQTEAQIESMHWGMDREDKERCAREVVTFLTRCWQNQTRGKTIGEAVLAEGCKERAHYALEQIAGFLERQKCNSAAQAIRALGQGTTTAPVIQALDPSP